jgi:hypothetical protein
LKKICVYLRSSAVFNVKLLLWEHIGAGIYYFKIYKYVALYPPQSTQGSHELWFIDNNKKKFTIPACNA